MEIIIDNEDEDEGELRVPQEGTFITKCEYIFGEFMSFEKGTRRLDTSIFTLQQLAIYLERLGAAKMPTELASRNRPVPGYLVHRGRPNLITCARIEQVPIALSIYATSFDEPLPTNDECLFCSNETSTEEVENFLRIAVKSNGRCIYTIVGIQELRYDTTIQVNDLEYFKSFYFIFNLI